MKRQRSAPYILEEQISACAARLKAEAAGPSGRFARLEGSSAMNVVSSVRVDAMSAKKPEAIAPSPLRRHAADALRRARKLPVGHARNDLRQLATGLLWLERRRLSEMAQQAMAGALEVGSDRDRHA